LQQDLCHNDLKYKSVIISMGYIIREISAFMEGFESTKNWHCVVKRLAQ
jgi:hypothetical protein